MKNWISIFSLLIIFSCKEEISIGTPNAQDILVVEGEVSDEPGTSYVKLSTTSSIDGLGANVLGIGAFVEVLDADGNSYVLKETVSGGIYEPDDNFKGTIGRSYAVHIILNNGYEYRSDFDRIRAPIKIQTLNVIYTEEAVEIDEFSTQRNRFHQLELIIPNSSSNQYFKIDSKGYAERSIFIPECFFTCPWPDDYVWVTTCWQVFNNMGNDLLVGSNQNIASDLFSYKANKIDLDSKGRFVGETKILSLSPSTFLYWQRLRSQLSQKGTMFDPPFQPVQGNIKPINHENRALGNFQAVSITTSDIFCIDRSEFKVTFDVFTASYPDRICIDIHSPGVEDLPFRFQECF